MEEYIYDSSNGFWYELHGTKTKGRCILQQPSARRGDASRVSKRCVTAVCSALWIYNQT